MTSKEVGDLVRRKTDEEFKEEVSTFSGESYEALDEYSGVKTKIRFRHIPCGKVITVRPDSFLARLRKCDCESDSSFKERVLELVGDEYVFLERYQGNRQPIRIKHNLCGREYTISPSNFFKGRRCSKCYFKSRKSDADFKEDVYSEVGDEYTFLERYQGNKVKTKVRHNDCGLVYEVKPSNFLHLGRRCPRCIRSTGEEAVAKTLESLNEDFVREWSIGGKLRADFYLPKHRAIIEYDGEQHYKSVKHWGGDEALKNNQFRDSVKDLYCEYTGIKMLRIPYWEKDVAEELVSKFIKELKEGGQYGGHTG